MRLQGALLYLPLAVAAALAVYPVAYLIFGSVWTQPPGFPGSFTLGNFAAAFSDSTFISALANSVAYSAGAAILATAVSFLLAFAVGKTDAPFRRLIGYSLLVTLALPWMVEDMSWTYLLSPRTGLYNVWLSALPGVGASLLNVYTVWGLIFVMGLSLTPLAYLIISPSLSLVDPHLEEASLVAGANLRSTFRRVELPLLRPAVLSAALLCFVIAMEAFDAAAIIGIPGRVHLLTTAIYAALQGYTPDYNLASAYSIVLVVITLLAMIAYVRSFRQVARYQTVSGRGGKREVFRLGRWRWLVGVMLLAYVFAYPVPVIGMLVYVSLHIYWNPFAPPPLTLQNYVDLLNFPSLSGGIANSLLVSALVALLTVGLASLVAYTSHRQRSIAGRFLGLAVFLPLAFPTLVLGVGLLWALAYSPLPIYGTIWALVLAYVVRYVPIATRFLAGPVLQVGRELEEASRICGASAQRTLVRIVLPILRPSLLTSALYVFIVSIKDLGAAVMLLTSTSTLFSAALYTIWSAGELLQAAAGGIVYMALLAAVLAIAATVFKVNLFGVLQAETRAPRAYKNTSAE